MFAFIGGLALALLTVVVVDDEVDVDVDVVLPAVFDGIVLVFDGYVLMLALFALALFASPPQAIPSDVRAKSAESAIAFFM